MKQIDFLVQAENAQQRLDKFLAAESKISRSTIRSLIEQGAVYVNDKRCRISSRTLYPKDKVRLLLSDNKEAAPPAPQALSAERIIFEDEDLVVVNKPPHLPTHATLDNARAHLVLLLQQHYAQIRHCPTNQVYIGLHHRLDRDTSGVILFTKRESANAPLAQAFQAQLLQKTYLAICWGKPEKKEFLIRSYLGPDPKRPRRFASVTRGGKFAETKVKCLSTIDWRGAKISLIQAEPLTGRTHQIRVHLSEAGLPILGDAVYGKPHQEIPRLLLHAWKLHWGERQWEAPVPEDFLALAFPSPAEIN
jgi:23S rRNA pseudouridine1911/1915/1917 synthase